MHSRGGSRANIFQNAFLKRFGKGTTPSAPLGVLRNIFFGRGHPS